LRFISPTSVRTDGKTDRSVVPSHHYFNHSPVPHLIHDFLNRSQDGQKADTKCYWSSVILLYSLQSR